MSPLRGCDAVVVLDSTDRKMSNPIGAASGALLREILVNSIRCRFRGADA